MKVKLIKEWAKSENGWVYKARGVHLRHLCRNDHNSCTASITHLYCLMKPKGNFCLCPDEQDAGSCP
jgi:hypothetical protein